MPQNVILIGVIAVISEIFDLFNDYNNQDKIWDPYFYDYYDKLAGNDSLEG